MTARMVAVVVVVVVIVVLAHPYYRPIDVECDAEDCGDGDGHEADEQEEHLWLHLENGSEVSGFCLVSRVRIKAGYQD